MDSQAAATRAYGRELPAAYINHGTATEYTEGFRRSHTLLAAQKPGVTISALKLSYGCGHSQRDLSRAAIAGSSLMGGAWCLGGHQDATSLRA